MNDITFQYYEENTQAFVDATLSVDMSKLYSEFLSQIKPGGHILDLGCGSGRDSREFIARGYQVTSIDGSPNLCQLAERVIGQPVLCMDFRNITFNREFDGVWACASLLHLASNEIPTMLSKVAKALKPNGILYFSFKYGNFEGMRGGRYYTDLTESSLSELITQVHDLKIIKKWLTEDSRPNFHDLWINVILER